MKYTKAIVALTTTAIITAGVFSGISAAYASTTALSSTVTSFPVGQTTQSFSLAWAPTLSAPKFLASLIFYPTLPGSSTWVRDSGFEATCSPSYPGGSLANCGIESLTVGGTTVLAKANKSNGASGLQVVLDSPMSVTSGTEIILTFKQGLLTTPTNSQVGTGSFRVTTNITELNPSATLGVAITAPATVTFDANGGAGTMNTQSAAISAALSSNSFTNAGYTFGGWATSQANATAGTVAYSDGASYPFTSSTTLYAIWTANGSGGSTASTGSDTLATTGTKSTPLLSYAGGLALVMLILGGVMVAARRMQKN